MNKIKQRLEELKSFLAGSEDLQDLLRIIEMQSEVIEKIRNDLVFELGHQEWVVASDKDNLEIIKKIVEKKIIESSEALQKTAELLGCE